MTPIKHGLVAVLDDDPSLRSALQRLLASHQYQVQTFASAEEFLLSPLRDQVECVVSDVALGKGMSGLQLCETLVACGYAPPFIFITASADSGARRRALALGCAFLEKPFSSDKLVQSVAKAITGPK